MSVKDPHWFRDTEVVYTKDASDYLKGFTEKIQMRGSYEKTPAVRECYKWCEANLGIKYKDWFMMNDVIYFKNTKKATMFRLIWCDLIS